MTKVTPKRTSLLLLAVVMNLIWALSYPLSKDVMLELSPLGLTFLRIFGGFVVIAPFIRRKDLPPLTNKKAYLWLGLMGLSGCALATLLQFFATRMTLASNISLIAALETIIIVVLGALLLKEKMGWLAWLGVGLAFAGVFLITVDPTSLELFSKDLLHGNLLMIASVLCYTAYTLIGKKMAARWGATTVTVLPFFMALFFLVPLILLIDPNSFRQILKLSGPSILKVIFIAPLGTGVGYLIWNWVLKYLSASDLSKTLYIQPVAGIFFSYWLLSEKISAVALIGGCLVLVGIGLGEKWETRK